MKTVVVNMRTEEYDARIDRASMFGNPFILHKDGDRELVIKKYKRWFYQMLEEEYFKEGVSRLKGKRLGCWCKPKACHGDVIVEYLEGKQ